MSRVYSGWVPERTVVVPAEEVQPPVVMSAQPSSDGNYCVVSSNASYSTARARGSGSSFLTLDYISGGLDYYQSAWWFYQSPLRFDTGNLPVGTIIEAKLRLYVYSAVSDVAYPWAIFKRGPFSYNLTTSSYVQGAEIPGLLKISQDVTLEATQTGWIEFSLNPFEIVRDAPTFLMVASPLQANSSAPSLDERWHGARGPGGENPPELIVTLTGSTPEPEPEPEPGTVWTPSAPTPWAYVSTPSDTVATSAAVGAFLGSDSTGRDNISGFQSWLNGPDILVGHSYLASANWQDLEGPNWVLDPWSDWLRAGPNRIFALNVPMVANNEPGQLSSGEISTRLANGANGQYNSHFQTLAQRLVAKNAADTTLVLGWEMTGFDFGHRASPNPTAWSEFWRQIVNTMRAVPGQQFVFNFSPNRGQDAIDWQSIWPGDIYVDEFGLSAYDQPQGADFNFLLNETPNGLNVASSFAASKGLTMSFPEWGLFRNGDNVNYIQGMFDFISNPANNVRWHSITDYSPHGVYRYTGNPNASARYRTRFSTVTGIPPSIT